MLFKVWARHVLSMPMDIMVTIMMRDDRVMNLRATVMMA